MKLVNTDEIRAEFKERIMKALPASFTISQPFWQKDLLVLNLLLYKENSSVVPYFYGKRKKN